MVDKWRTVGDLNFLFVVLCEIHMGFRISFSKPPSGKPINQHYLWISPESPKIQAVCLAIPPDDCGAEPITQRECQCLMDTSVALTSRLVGVGGCCVTWSCCEPAWGGRKPSFQTLKGQLIIGIQNSSVQGTAYWKSPSNNSTQNYLDIYSLHIFPIWLDNLLL